MRPPWDTSAQLTAQAGRLVPLGRAPLSLPIRMVRDYRVLPL